MSSFFYVWVVVAGMGVSEGENIQEKMSGSIDSVYSYVAGVCPLSTAANVVVAFELYQ